MTKKQMLAAGSIAVAVAAGIPITYIVSDGGGFVLSYSRKYEKAWQNGEKIVIKGACYSSCTMALGYPNACLMPKAELGFHPAYTPYLFGLFGYDLNPEATEELKRHYPADALEVINKHNGLENHPGRYSPKITVIKGSEFPKRYQCT